MDEIKVGDRVRYSNQESQWYGSIWDVIVVNHGGARPTCKLRLSERFNSVKVGDEFTFWTINLTKVDGPTRRLEVVVIFAEGVPINEWIEAFKCHNAHLINQYEGFRRQTQYIFRCETAHDGLAKMLILNKEIKQFTWCWL
jgi:hypothetical protein